MSMRDNLKNMKGMTDMKKARDEKSMEGGKKLSSVFQDRIAKTKQKERGGKTQPKGKKEMR